MSAEATDALGQIIDKLREHPTELNLFRELENILSLENSASLQTTHGVVLQQYTNLDQPLNLIRFKRLSAVYNRQMYNKFFVPIWAAAMDADIRTGYLLYPKLTPIKTVLLKLRSAGLDSESYVKDLHKVLRICIAPIALAIDALHTELPNKRTVYYHRNVCVDNIYMDVQYGEDMENTEYDDARLRLTELTRGTYEDYVDINQSIHSKSLFSEYYHHPDLRDKEMRYDRIHDWYSFGVYILEVLYIILPIKLSDNFYEIEDYSDVRELIERIKRCNDLDTIQPYILHYIAIAVKCITLQSDERRELSYEMPLEMRQEFMEYRLRQHAFKLEFEYDIHTWTAELLWMYEDSQRWRPTDGSDSCRACLLRPKDKFHTEFYSQARRDKCNDECLYYCIPCYTNGERLFCSKRHGTSSTIVGGHNSYALVLYGQSLDSLCSGLSEDDNPFKKEAGMLANALQHKLICGVPKKNMLIGAVYGEGSDPEDRLRQHCRNMFTKIHGDEEACTNEDAAYTLFVFYSGHGYRGSDRTVGDWCPAFNRRDEIFEPIRLKRAKILRPLSHIRSCSNHRTDNPECQAACVEIFYLSNPSGPPPGSLSHVWTSDNILGHGTISASASTNSSDPSDITRWFCQMLRSLYYTDCCEKPRCAHCISKRKDEHDSCRRARCKVPMGKIDLCTKLTRYIYEELLEGFIDGECLRHHHKHLIVKNRYRDLHVSIEDEYGPPILAYYNPKGVYLQVFNYREVGEEVEIDFECDMKCEKVVSRIKDVLQKRDKHPGKTHISLLTTGANDNYYKYDLVCDNNINRIIGFSVLFYHVITKPVQVTLRAITADETETMEYKMYLALGDTDLCHIVYESKWSDSEDKRPVAIQRNTQLPNILVYVVHHLRYHLNEGGGTPPDNPSTSKATEAIQLSEPMEEEGERTPVVYQPVDTDEEDNDSVEQMETEEQADDIRQAVRNSFLETLGQMRFDTTPSDEVMELVEKKARNYWCDGGVGVFSIRKTAEAKIGIEWKRATHCTDDSSMAI